jgi:hypothetical protein
MAGWNRFSLEEPQLAASGRRLLSGSDDSPIAFIATHSQGGTPHLAPVCPIFFGEDLYLSVGSATPKCNDLKEDGRFVLHAFLGDQDEEFQVAGKAIHVTDTGEIVRVQAAIKFTFRENDPIFRLDLSRALWAYWENVGKPDTLAVRKRWYST